MRVVVALGGNALARRGEPMTAGLLRENARSACRALAELAKDNELVVTHGNGPQVGLLALQNLSYEEVAAYPLDILGAETQGMIGYVIQQELGNALAGSRPIAGVVTTTVVDENDPAFDHPTKFIGPTYTAGDVAEVAAEYRWTIGKDGDNYRRVVPSPQPIHIIQSDAVKLLLDSNYVVVAVGGGGVPVKTDAAGEQEFGVQAVIDKDLASATLAAEIGADTLIILTDADFVSQDWGTPQQKNILTASVEAISKLPFAEGSMKPKVDAAIRVAEAGGRALIGPLDRLPELLARRVGTEITAHVDGDIVYA